MPQPKNATNKSKGQKERDLRPQFKTPHSGGSYLLDPKDLGKNAHPVFVEGTDQEPTAEDRSAVKAIQTGKAGASTTPDSSD